MLYIQIIHLNVCIYTHTHTNILRMFVTHVWYARIHKYTHTHTHIHTHTHTKTYTHTTPELSKIRACIHEILEGQFSTRFCVPSVHCRADFWEFLTGTAPPLKFQRFRRALIRHGQYRAGRNLQQSHTRTNTYTHTQTYTYTHTHTHTPTHTHTRTHTHIVLIKYGADFVRNSL